MPVRVEVKKGFKSTTGEMIWEDQIVDELIKAISDEDEFGVRLLITMLKNMGAYNKYPELRL